MTSDLILLTISLTILLAVAGLIIQGLGLLKLPTLRRLPIHRTVLVVLEGTTIRGALLRHTRRLIVLGSAEVLHAGADNPPTPIDGTVYLDPARVRWLQAPTE